MDYGQVLLIIVALAMVGFFAGRSRALRTSGGDPVALHSRPSYYGFHVLLATLLPALGVVVLVAIATPRIENAAALSNFPAAVAADAQNSDIALSQVRSMAANLHRLGDEAMERLRAAPTEAAAIFAENGVAIGGAVEPFIVVAAEDLVETRGVANAALWAVAVLTALGGGLAAARLISPSFRARNSVERVVLYLLMAASAIAILTTIGIVLSMLSETLRFFKFVSPIDFFFGLTWDPRFAAADDVAGAQGGQFGILPLVWGTLYISFIALLIAVPIGLMAAIYMSEYASKSVRAVAKPVLEVLAGIPTIVYGFFALVTVGPLLRDLLARPLGLGDSATSVMTAGVVMGIMIIPFVSSLSDDIINAVPQSLRDGSFGLGATKSETIRNVILPAALPGIVGAILLAASRAIGETMIVVLAAGVATRLSLNPFQEMTTITVKIVSQLTGDTEFTSPQTLVAFALGLTLFFVTLTLNIYALYIVRKYREQYE
jgi:phosphate transport system permease protein